MGRRAAEYRLFLIPWPDAPRYADSLSWGDNVMTGASPQGSAAGAYEEMLAVASHELRTPIHAILGWVRLLRRGALDELGSTHALEAIERNAWTQAQLVSRLADVSRLTTSDVNIDMTRVDLGATIKAAVDALGPEAETKSIVLDVYGLDASEIVRGDTVRLQQVFSNLLYNAVKFTPEGGRIAVYVERGADHIDIRVTDTGIGIDADRLSRLFEPGGKPPHLLAGTSQRLGLGLRIVAQIVQAHGGVVVVQSPGAGGGSTFTVRLPVA
jgi:signal transduction histidine kinase